MDILVAWSITSMAITATAVIGWTSWIAWQRFNGQHADWW
jgi:hypothetical protein